MSLPDELLDKVMQELDNKDVVHLAATCRELRRPARSHLVLRRRRHVALLEAAAHADLAHRLLEARAQEGRGRLELVAAPAAREKGHTRGQPPWG